LPSYEFTCPACGGFDRHHPMTDVPESAPCPACRKPARRRISGGTLLHSSTAVRLLDATARTAAEPPIVAAPPGRGARITRNPLHRKLPRP
jgi:putative FmdB family regulatory protein